MGFYGNVTNTDKTTFSFDLTYTTRVDMDKNADTDGVFLGRYVLVDYDGEVVKAYYDPNTDRFYNTANFSVSTMITPHEGVIVQNLHDAMSPQSFYQWSNAQKAYQRLNSNTPYQARFSQDVKEYGRAYDSTVWVKRYDVAMNSYKYAMIAELNAVVPTLHMVVNQPNSIPVTPYFDRDTTNIDYYLHMQSDFGTRVKKADQDIKSDEQATRIMAHWTQDATGHQAYHEEIETVPADIYYNNAGFDPVKRTFMEDKITYYLKDDNNKIIEGKEAKEIDYSVNSIGYDMGQSGRKYGADADFGVYTNGVQADDIYDWYFRLPGIGNAICKMWDKVYDDRGNGKIRALNKAQKENDVNSHLVSYDKETLIGMMNTTQELLGYHFIPTNEIYKAGYSITDGNAMIENTLVYNTFDEGRPTTTDTSTYKLLNCLFYDKPQQDDRAVTQYYHFAYTPTYTPATGEELEEGVTYYHFVNGKWELANPAIYKQTDANGNPVVDKNTNQVLAIGAYHTRNNKWTLVPLESGLEDNFYSLINLIHNLLGTDADDVRSLDTVKGTINHLKDIIANINLDLSPGKLLHTNNSGVIETTDTYFPSADWDKDELLAGDGTWVSRFASIKVRENSTNSNRKIPKVVTFETTGETTGNAPAKLLNQMAELVSDNQRTQEGTTLVYKQEHDPNTLILATRDKWIRLHPDAVDDSIEFEHTQSELVNRLSYQDYATLEENAIEGPAADINSNVNTANFKANEDGTELTIVSDSDIALLYADTEYDSNDNRLTIPYITVDNAGHVVSAGTKNYNIPNSFKKISTSTIEDTNENESLDQAGISIAEEINDTLHLSSRNRWIDIATETTNNNEGDEEDTITWSHRLAPTQHFKTDVVLNGERRTSEDEIPTVYRYGLPANKDISTLDSVNGNEATNTFNIPYIEIDKAGHVVAAETHTVELPENFTTVTLKPQDESTIVEAHTVAADTVLAADTLTDNLTLKTVNRWIGIGLADTENNDEITFGHRLSDIKDVVPLELNGERRADNKYEKVYRYGLEADKDISTLDENNGVELANTFNVPYMEIDEAGHIVHAETHTVELPDGYTTINIGEPISDDLTTDELADAETMIADTLTETLTINPSNKWIRLKGENTKGIDTITIGHEIHKITPTTSAEDLDGETQKDKFTTQTVTWDDAGHIIGHDTKTWTLPDSFHNFKVIGQSTSVNNGNLSDGDISADNTFDTVTLKPSNKWIRLYADEEFDTIEIGHVTQDGKAGSYTGTDLEFTEFGGTVTIYGYKTDEAGHIIDNPTYNLTLPKGSYEEIESNGANVLTSLSFTDNTGALVGSKTNIGDLLLTGYTTENITSAAITATDSLNKAIAKIEAQIVKEQTDRIADVDAEEQARVAAIDAEAKVRTDADTVLQENINKEIEDRTAANEELSDKINKEIEDREAADETLSSKIDTEIEDRKTAISEEASARAKADEDEVAARDKAIADAVQALWQDLLKNYNLVLTPPVINSISKTAIDSNYSVQLVANITAVEGDTYSYSWNTGETGNTIEVTAAGIYTCTVTRTHNGYTSTSSKDIEVLESEIPVPVIPEEPVEPQPEEPIV